MPGFIDSQGNQQQFELSVTDYRAAADAGQSLPEYLQVRYGGHTDVVRHGSVFEQACASEGIFLRGNAQVGIRASTMHDILQPSAAVTTRDAVEDRLTANLDITPNAFEQMIAITESVSGERYEQPKINYDNPSAARSQIITQLAKPAAMMLITVSDKSYTIPTYSLGLEISDQALRATTLDLVTLSLARQIAVERNARAQEYILNLLNGDVDSGESSLATLGKTTTAVALDGAATTNITQKAWIKFLSRESTKRTLTHVVTDLDGAMAIENRTGRPNVQTDDPKSPRINSLMELINPLWPSKVKLFLTLDSSWPAATIMGLDNRYAVRRVRNLLADYTAIESFVLRRAQAMRFDFGEKVERLFDEAFDSLTYTPA
jgi:hypothetical protein